MPLQSLLTHCTGGRHSSSFRPQPLGSCDASSSSTSEEGFRCRCRGACSVAPASVSAAVPEAAVPEAAEREATEREVTEREVTEPEAAVSEGDCEAV